MSDIIKRKQKQLEHINKIEKLFKLMKKSVNESIEEDWDLLQEILTRFDKNNRLEREDKNNLNSLWKKYK